MDKILKFAVVLLLIAATWTTVQVAAFFGEARAVARIIPSEVSRQGDEAREALRAEIAALRADLRGEIRTTRSDVLRRVDGLQLLVDDHAARLETAASTELQQTRRELLSELRPAVGEAVNLMATYRAVPATMGARLDPWTDCHGNGACWQAQFTAALGATRSAIGQVAHSAPRVAASVERSAVASERATAATAAAMSNIAEVTKPLPRYIRIPLQIMGPTAPLWLPFAVR